MRVSGSWLPGSQTRGSGQDTNHCVAGAQLKVGSAVLAIGGTNAIEKNCARDLLPLVGIWRPISFHKNTRGSRLDGQYGNGAVLSDVAGFAYVTRGKDYHLLDHPLIQARLHLPPDQVQQRPRYVDWRAAFIIPP